jgi:hypothetical protein
VERHLLGHPPASRAIVVVQITSRTVVLERISYEYTAYSKTLDARFREHDTHEVIPA